MTERQPIASPSTATLPCGRRHRHLYPVDMQQDDLVGLRPAQVDDVWLFEKQAVEPEAGGIFNWSGFRNIASLKRRLDENGLIDADGGCLVITSEGSAVGTVVWTRVTYGTAIWACWNIGISILPDHRRRGIGTRAQRLLVEYLFNTTPVERIEAYTDVKNLAEQRSLSNAGFKEEGTLRAVQFRAGHWRDVLIYSILRDEFTAQQFN